MKKILSVALMLILILSISACGAAEPVESAVVTTEAATEVTAQPTTEPTTQPTEPEDPGVTILSNEVVEVILKNERDMIVTLKGLSIQDKYLTNRAEAMQYNAEYLWDVCLYNDDKWLSVGSAAYAYAPGEEQEKSIQEMQCSIGVDIEGTKFGNTIFSLDEARQCIDLYPVETSTTPDSITWRFTIPETRLDSAAYKYVIYDEAGNQDISGVPLSELTHDVVFDASKIDKIEVKILEWGQDEPFKETYTLK